MSDVVMEGNESGKQIYFQFTYSRKITNNLKIIIKKNTKSVS